MGEAEYGSVQVRYAASTSCLRAGSKRVSVPSNPLPWYRTRQSREMLSIIIYTTILLVANTICALFGATTLKRTPRTDVQRITTDH